MGQEVANIFIDGAVTGCIYGLIGVGFVILYRATGVVSFAQGSFMVIGALLFTTLTASHLEFYLAYAVDACALFLIGAVLYRTVFARLVGSHHLVTAVATIGLGTALDAAAILIWQPSLIDIQAPYSFQLHGVGVFRFSGIQIFSLCLTAVVFAAISLTLQRTKLGLRMRAVANSEQLAAHVGVNVVRTSMFAWALAAMAAALAGVTYVLGSQSDPGTVYSIGLAAFPAIILGGFDSIGGSLVGGLLIGWLLAFVATYVGGQWPDVVSYLALLVLLLVRPQGLFGSPEVARL
jgi:branched-chain amino acid transport system permease protein